MSGNKRKNNTKNVEDKMSFFDRMKTDKKYSAKVQFIGWGIFLLLLIIYLNVASANGNVVSNSVGNTVNDILDEEVVEEQNDDETLSLLDKLDDNYEYDININLLKGENEEVKYRYYGKSSDDNVIINKVTNDVSSTYYNVDDYYYIKNDSEEYQLVQSSEVYDLVDSKYIEVDDVLDLIDKASLDHVVDSSTGERESVYNLLVRDVVISNKSEDVVTISVIENSDKLSIVIDYTNLLKVFDEKIQKCEISYIYTNIGNVESFSIMEDKVEE